MNPERFCTPCQWNGKSRVPATWVALNQEDGLAMFLCDACKAGYHVHYTAITINEFWETLHARRSLELMGVARRCKEVFDGATCNGHVTGAPRRCVRCGKYQREASP